MQRGEREELAGLYCEKTISRKGELEIVNALKEDEWQPDNPDIEMGLISYLGLPLSWPDGEIFGTICVLGREPRKFKAEEKELFQQFKAMIEADLKLIEQQKQIRSLIRDKTKKEKELKRSKRLLEQNERLAGVGGWEYYADEDRVYWTDELFRLHGFPLSADSELKAGYIEKSLKQYPEPYREQVETAFQRAVAEGKSYELEVRFVSADGKRMWVKTAGEPVTDSSGRVVRVLGTFIDITEFKNIQLKLKERVKELDCLHTIANYLADNSLTLPEMFDHTLTMLSGYFWNPERTAIQLTYRDKVYGEADCQVSQKVISSPLEINGRVAGRLTAIYCGEPELENPAVSRQNPFLPEEEKPAGHGGK